MIRYIGDGAYFQGIPARDLSDDEFAALSEAQQQALLASGLYTPEAAPAPTRAKKAATTIEPVTAEAPTGG